EGVDLGQPGFVALDLRAAVLHRVSSVERGPYRPGDRADVVLDERVRHPGGGALLAADGLPHQGTVFGVELGDAGLLLYYLRTVEAKPALPGHDDVAAQPSSYRHAAEATDHARDHADHRHVGAQSHDRRVYLGHGEQPEVGLLQPDATRFQEQHGADSAAALDIPQGQLERAGYLGARDLADAAPLEEPLDGEHDRLVAVEVAAGHHDPVVARGHHALWLEVRGFQ